jgi:hypothetical protein
MRQFLAVTVLIAFLAAPAAYFLDPCAVDEVIAGVVAMPEPDPFPARPLLTDADRQRILARGGDGGAGASAMIESMHQIATGLAGDLPHGGAEGGGLQVSFTGEVARHPANAPAFATGRSGTAPLATGSPVWTGGIVADATADGSLSALMARSGGEVRATVSRTGSPDARHHMAVDRLSIGGLLALQGSRPLRFLWYELV